MRTLVLTAVIAGLLSPNPILAAAQSGRLSVAYLEPKRGEYRKIYDGMRARKVLERLSAVLSEVRLPARLTLTLSECGGEPNAWYAPETRTVTVCYKYLADILRRAPKRISNEGITREEALVGPVMQVFLHETGHALFDLLDVPVLGREEDAADQVATLTILRLGPARAREVIEGSAFLLASYAGEEKPGKAAYADAHGFSAQRLYNLVCLAYGSDPRRFGYVVAKGFLPKDRAESCGEEYDQVAYAFKRLIGPYLVSRDRARARLRRAFGARR